MGLDLVEHGLVSEVLGRSPIGHYVFNCQAPDAGNIEILHKYATEEQKAQWLQPLVDGRIRSCFSMTEVDMPGSNPVMMETTAEKDGDDYVINGQKWYTTSADGAAFAIVMAVTNPEAPPYLQASMNHRAYRHAGLQPGAQHSGDGASGHRLRLPWRNSLSELPGAPNQPAGARGARLRHRPGTPRARAHSPLHALAGHRPAILRPDVPAGQHPQDFSRRAHARVQADHPGLDRRVRR